MVMVVGMVMGRVRVFAQAGRRVQGEVSYGYGCGYGYGYGLGLGSLLKLIAECKRRCIS